MESITLEVKPMSDQGFYSLAKQILFVPEVRAELSKPQTPTLAALLGIYYGVH